MRKSIIKIGQRFGRWVVLGEGEPIIEPSGRKRLTLKVMCDCGVAKDVNKSILVSGKSKSCGCLQKEICSEIGKATGPINCFKYAHGWNKGLYGEDNPCYKGKTRLSVNIRNSEEYKDWRTKCFERDNYTCQISGVKGNIVVHHIEAFSVIISDLDIYNYRECELLWDINNGITISKELHDKFHNIYGKKGFTKENFLEFKNKYNVPCKY